MDTQFPTLIGGGLFALACIILGVLLADRSTESKLRNYLLEVERLRALRAKREQRKPQKIKKSQTKSITQNDTI